MTEQEARQQEARSRQRLLDNLSVFIANRTQCLFYLKGIEADIKKLKDERKRIEDQIQNLEVSCKTEMVAGGLDSVALGSTVVTINRTAFQPYAMFDDEVTVLKPPSSLKKLLPFHVEEALELLRNSGDQVPANGEADA